MGKNKLKKFAEMETFENVYQCAARELLTNNEVTKKAGKWNAEVFHNDHPIVLELGCGRGEYTVGLAALNPDVNYIGVDIKGARLWAGAKQAVEANMTNVAFLRTNIELIPNFFAKNEISEIWITFPDPQMKKATKRLTSTYFMQRYQKIVRKEGLIHLKTDSMFLYTYTKAMVTENKYPVLADTKDLYAEPEDNATLDDARRLKTHYEHQWLDRGLTIKYICWQLSLINEFIEPEIDIERDTYRSYGRNYVSATNN